ELVAAAAPVEEAVARRPEALPELLRLPVWQWPAALPLGLELLDARRGGVPVARIRKRLDLLAERRLLLCALASVDVPALEVLLPACEEAIARLAKLLPDGRRVPGRYRADLLPLRLEALDQLCRRVPIRRCAEVRHLRAECPLLLEVVGEVGVAPAAELVADRSEAVPERLRLVRRRACDGRPLLLQPAELTHALGDVVRLEDHLDSFDDLFLSADVRPTPPLLG